MGYVVLVNLGVAAAVLLVARRRLERRRRVLVVGSINVDLYQRTKGGAVAFAGKPVDLTPIKGMTLPAASFVATPKVASQLSGDCKGKEEALVLTMDGPFVQKTGGKGANAAAAAGQTFRCEFLGNMGQLSTEENVALARDLAHYGAVSVERASTLAGQPTGTAYILLFEDNDNAILLIGGANQVWPPQTELEAPGGPLHAALQGAVCVMLQREVPAYVNVSTAKLARGLGVPVFMDVGGTDAPLDEALMPHICVVAPNESELTFISGVPTTDADGEVRKPLVRAAVAALRARFAAAGNPAVEVLVTLGAKGSMHFGPEWTPEGGEASGAHETRMGRFGLTTPDGRPKDTTGAGDCYRGSYVGMRYGEGRPIAEAMRWAAAAAACSVEVEGAMPSMPPCEQIAARGAQTVVGLEDF